jgi:sulfur carrier protein
VTIDIHLNGEMRVVAADSHLESLVSELGLPSQRIAVELNGSVVPRTAWTDTQLANNDRLEVVHFVGGG